MRATTFAMLCCSKHKRNICEEGEGVTNPGENSDATRRRKKEWCSRGGVTSSAINALDQIQAEENTLAHALAERER